MDPATTNPLTNTTATANAFGLSQATKHGRPLYPRHGLYPHHGLYPQAGPFAGMAPGTSNTLTLVPA